MSAIWGAISLTGEEINQSDKEILREAYKECIIDRYEEIQDKDVYMGCGIQYITPEAEREVLPVKHGDIFFDADVMLDNRITLCNKIGKKEDISVPDGEILFDFYEQFQEKGLNEMLGAYTFVYYDRKKKEIHMVSDAVGCRFVNYMIINKVFYYSSLIKPLEQIIRNKTGKLELNYRWIGDYIGQDNYNMFTECEETPVMNIYRIAPAGIIKVTGNGIEKNKYWDPFRDRIKIRYKTQQEYKEHFLKLYTESVECVLRSNKETAIFLSGGYDSTSIAALAAPLLQKKGKKLYSFTSVPFKGYQSEFAANQIVDETDLVKKTQEYFQNIECEFMDLPDMNPWYDRKEYMKIAEMPYKSPENLLWMYEGMKKAYDRGARIILKGAFGNGTVSYDNCIQYMVWLFRRGHWIRLVKEVQALRYKRFYTRKSVLKTTVKNSFGFPKNKVTFEQLFGESFAKQEFLKKNGSWERLYERTVKEEKSIYSCDKYRKLVLEDVTFRHYGEFEQRNSLYTGVLVRDPTKDKRIIEFTIGIPYDQFTHDGVFRRLIAEYMEGIVPEHIIHQKGQGRQSADLKARVLRNQENICAEWMEIFENHINNPFIDCKKAMSELQSRGIDQLRDFEIARYIYTLIFLEYIDSIAM